VWREDPREIADRLGWLTIAGSMRSEVPRIRAWRTGLAAEGVRDVVLLGMGGSSLAPEVFRRTFPAEAGGTRLHVLDSTSPAWIRRVTAAVDPRALHVLVASKSGTTIEIETLYAHFRELVRETEGDGWPRRFTAITDPGTVLAQRAGAERFHAAWLNPADIGGRFSALSFFGLVPGAVLGIDLEALLARAEAMGAACGPDVPAARNPGAVLGAFLAAGVRAGRDRMTLLASRSLAAFGLWVEQLLAESTGKDGTGIVPIVDEPDAGITGSHRMFVALEDPQDDSRLTDALERVRRRGDPLLVLPCTRAELGAEMFRWEFATAVAGHLLGIHPFDQPDVQSAKTRTGEILGRLEVGTPGSPPTAGDPLATLRAVRPGDWVGLMVYGDPTAPLDDAVRALRIAVRELFDAATTLGLGPRFLHSTGQLHKGGADRGVFLQILLAEDPLPIPGRSWGFDQLIRAQADGDLEALRERGRRVARLEADDPAAAVRSLAVALRG
jgi:glucose-6-phosphate isomerase/transaldolase/glucose-6-phosphate isomerase